MSTLKTQFNALDVDGDGKLKSDELKDRLMYTCGINTWQADFLLQAYDENHDGQLNRDEFMELLDSLFG